MHFAAVRDIFEFKTPYRFFWHQQLQYVKKLVGFYSNSLHCKFEFFTKHLTSQDFLFFIFGAFLLASKDYRSQSL